MQDPFSDRGYMDHQGSPIDFKSEETRKTSLSLGGGVVVKVSGSPSITYCFSFMDHFFLGACFPSIKHKTC